jgi:hypothetical protein
MKPKTPKPLEKYIQAQIMAYLNYRHIFAWVNKTQGTYNAKRGVFIKTQMKKGVSDILGILPDGRFMAIEVKRLGGKLSPEQETFLGDINKRGGLAFKADNVQVVADMLGV